jgi:hypothetical protein
MRRIQALVAVGLILVLVGSASAAGKGKGKGKGNRPVRGTVESVTPESVVVKVQQGKKGGGEATEKTFQLGPDTKFEFVTIKRAAKGEKPEMETKPASLSDIKAGERVQITGGGTAAEKVSIVQGGRKGKKKADGAQASKD